MYSVFAIKFNFIIFILINYFLIGTLGIMFLSTIRVIQNKMSDRTPISIDNRLRALISQIGDANSPAQDLDIGKTHYLNFIF